MVGQRHWEDPVCPVTLWYDLAHQCHPLPALTGVQGRGPAAPMSGSSREVTEAALAPMQGGCKGFQWCRWVIY